MAPILNFLQILILVALLQHVEATRYLKSFKFNEKIIYDCVDIYKQPAFSHPLLKDHTLQMKPSLSINESNAEASNERYEGKIGCPDGMVPILRTRKEDLAMAHQFAERHFGQFTADRPGAHIAMVTSRSKSQGLYRGAGGAMSVHQVNVGKDQASYAQVFVAGGTSTQVNVIQAGWMINPSLFGDARTWSFGFWKGKNRQGCYNLACPGFVQVAKGDPLSEAINVNSKTRDGVLQISIHQDKQTGNWWITQIKSKATVHIGYWPKELFDLISGGAAMVGFGGTVQGPPSGPSPPMGNGHFPDKKKPKESAYFTNLEIIDSGYKSLRADSFPLENLVDSEKCYGLKYGGYSSHSIGVVFLYGGPGGNSCGV